MTDALYTASAAVTTLFVLAVVVGVARAERRRDYDPLGPTTTARRLREAAGEPVVWMASFLLLAFVFGGGTVLYVSDATVPGRALLAPGLLAAAVAVFAGAMFLGVYQSARSRGGSAAQGVAEGSFLVGLLVVVAIAAKLVV
jgi:hypothetical protein